MTADESAARSRRARRNYRCFLLRCRYAAGAANGAERYAGAAAGWRFTVQEAGKDGEHRSFACLKEFEAYLEAELESTATYGATGESP